MSALVTVEEIKAAARRVDGVIVKTPLIPFPDTEPRLLIKPESLQPTGSFKLRGAFSAISALSDAQRERGVVAHSSGNHALSVAYAAEALGVPAVVVVPDNALAVKVTAAARHGARIVTVEPTLEARIAGAQELIDQYGYTLIPPFDHRDVIAGQGTIGLEIAADRPDTDLMPEGQGGRRGAGTRGGRPGVVAARRTSRVAAQRHPADHRGRAAGGADRCPPAAAHPQPRP